MPYFQHRDHKLHYDLFTGLVPEDTLLIHGNLASNAWWKPTVRELTHRYATTAVTGRLAMAEWLGCGKSSAPQSLADLEMKTLASDYVAFVKGLGMSDVNLVGHSTGGLIALYAALEAPELFTKILLLDSVGAQGVQLAPEMLAAFERMKVDKDFCKTVMASTIHDVNVEDAEFLAIVDDTFGVADLVWTGMPQVLSKTDARQDLAQLPHPVLVAHGELDPIIPKEDSKAMALLLPKAEYRELKGQGHSCNMENPERFCDLLVSFFYSERTRPEAHV